MAESYFQYAEHYFRILGAMQAAQQSSQGYGPPNGQAPHNGHRRFQGDGPGDGQDGGVESSDAIEQQLERQENISSEQPPAMDRRDIPIGSSPPEG